MGKWNTCLKGKIIDEFVGLRSKMYSMKTIAGKESNTTKRVNIATDLMSLKKLYLIKK